MILNMLVEGMSMRSISRTAGVSINTVSKLLVEAGEACAEYHDEIVRGVHARRVQRDEIWSFAYAKEKTAQRKKLADAGNVWTWTALNSDSKMILSWECWRPVRRNRNRVHGRSEIPSWPSRPVGHGRPQGISGSGRRCLWRRHRLRAIDQAAR